MSDDSPRIQFAHVSYRLAERFGRRNLPQPFFQTWNAPDTLARAAETNVLVISGLWQLALLDAAPALRYVQVCAAGYDNFDVDALKARGVRIANSAGVNRNAVSDHAMALIAAISRRLPEARDYQHRKHWRGMVSDFAGREDELAGKTLHIYGLGAIGERLARLARAFEMRVVGYKRDPSQHGGNANDVRPAAAFVEHLGDANFVALCCPLTDETRHVMNAHTLGRMREDAWLVNVARGGCVDTRALIQALSEWRIGGAALDVTEPEPLPADSPLWTMGNVILTPHTGGETRAYEDNVIDILVENLGRLDRDEELRNELA